jgi:hypothetical protein
MNSDLRIPTTRGIERLDALLNMIFLIRAQYSIVARLLAEAIIAHGADEHHLRVCTYLGHAAASCSRIAIPVSSKGMETFLSVNYCDSVLEILAPLVAFLLAGM